MALFYCVLAKASKMEESRSAGCSTLTMVDVVYVLLSDIVQYLATQGPVNVRLNTNDLFIFLLATPSVQTVKPFSSTDLKQIALPDILCNFRIMVAENIPDNPLCYLYPNTPKDQAFGKYYSEKTGGKLFMWNVVNFKLCNNINK